MGSKIKFVYWALHIGAFLYTALGMLLIALIKNVLPLPEELNLSMDSQQKVIFLILVGFCFVLAVFCEVVLVNLKRERFWAWVAALITMSLFTFSIFFPIGVLGLIGLLEGQTRKHFGQL